MEQGELLTLPSGHALCVEAVAITTDGRYILSASADSTLRVWDLDSLAMVVHSGRTNGDFAGSTIPDGQPKIPSVKTGMPTRQDPATELGLGEFAGHTQTVKSMVATLDGQRVLSGSYDRILRVWDCEKGAELTRLFGHHGGVVAVEVAPDGSTAASLDQFGRLIVWDLRRKKPLTRLAIGCSGLLRRAAVTADGQCAVFLNYDDVVAMWSLA